MYIVIDSIQPSRFAKRENSVSVLVPFMMHTTHRDRRQSFLHEEEYTLIIPCCNKEIVINHDTIWTNTGCDTYGEVFQEKCHHCGSVLEMVIELGESPSKRLGVVINRIV